MQVLDEINVLGLSEKTIIVVWSPHGVRLGDSPQTGTYGSWTNYKTDSRVPLLVRTPSTLKARGGTNGASINGRKGSKRRGGGVNSVASWQEKNQYIELVDMYPTLVDLVFGTSDPDVAAHLQR